MNAARTKASTETQSVTNIYTVETILSRADNKFDVLRFILGGDTVIEQPIRSEMDLIDLAKDGVKRASLVSVSNYLGVTMDRMSEILHVSPRTLQRKGEGNVLGVFSSEQAIEVAEVISTGLQVFGSIERFHKWLYGPLLALGGTKPIDLLDTSFGTKLLVKELGRLEHGVFS